MPHNRAYLAYHHRLGQLMHQGIATPVERARYHPELTAQARGIVKPHRSEPDNCTWRLRKTLRV